MVNHIQDFNDRLERRFSKAYAEQSTLDWVKANTTLNGAPFSTKGYEFQDAIINDWHPNLDVMKISQCGLTEVQLRKALAFLVRNPRTRLIFTIPSVELHRALAQTRLKPILERDKVFNLEQDAKAVRSMDIVQLGESFLYPSTVTEEGATSKPADVVFNDEIDLSNPQWLSLFTSRMQNSNWKINQRFSTPTFAGLGIDAGYKASDQRRYMIRCEACGHWQWPEFNTSFCHFPDLPSHVEDLLELTEEDTAGMDLAKAQVVCEKCHTSLSPEASREWVAAFPGRVNARGYWISPFSTTRITLADIVLSLGKYKKREFLRGFHNTVLGQTYEDAQSRIPENAIKAALEKGSPNTSELPTDRALAVGIDMGLTVHMVIGNTQGTEIYLMEQLPVEKLAERLAGLDAKHKIACGVIDRQPYTPDSYAIRDKTNNRVMPARYATASGSVLTFKNDEYGRLAYVDLPRTEALDRVRTKFCNYELTLNGYSYQKQVVIEHLRDMVRDESPEQMATWKKVTGVDHYFHAIAYWLAAPAIRELAIEAEGIDNSCMIEIATPRMTGLFPAARPRLVGLR